MALGCRTRLRSPASQLELKLFLKVRTDVKAKLDMQTSAEKFLLSQAQICRKKEEQPSQAPPPSGSESSKSSNRSWMNPSPTAAPSDTELTHTLRSTPCSMCFPRRLPALLGQASCCGGPRQCVSRRFNLRMRAFFPLSDQGQNY